jgi:hypothetical protein
MKVPREQRGRNPRRGRPVRRAYARIAAYRPPRSLIAAAVIAISIFLLGGGIYDIFMSPLAVLPTRGGRFLSFIPGRINEQLLVGSIGVMILYALGALGLILIYHSVRYIRSQRHALIFMGIGVALVLLSFITVESILFWIVHYY